MVFEIKLEATPELKRALREIEATRTAVLVEREMKRAINEGSLLLKNKLVDATPTGGTGLTREGWQVEPARRRSNRELVGEVGNTQAIPANILETGAERHFPPPMNLGQWVRRKLGMRDEAAIRRTSFLIARAISKRGLPGPTNRTGVLSAVLIQVTPEIEARLDAALGRVIREIGGPR